MINKTIFEIKHVSKLMTISVFILVIAFSCKPDKTEIEPVRPNVVFILADDLGIHDLGFTGSDYYKTPNIDQIAREGFVFTQGYAASRVCSPSRASILLVNLRHVMELRIGLEPNRAKIGVLRDGMINCFPLIMSTNYQKRKSLWPKP